MTSIPSFGESLLAKPPVKQVPPVTVEDILNSTPSPQPAVKDSFETSQPVPPQQKNKSGGLLSSLISTAVGAGVIFFAGRKGWLGKSVKTWFGGRLSLDKAHKKIAAQMQEYMSRYGNVRGVTVENKNLLKVEMENGTIKEYRIIPKKGDSIIQLEGTPSKNRREIINFNREDASPMHRILFRLNKKGYTKGYVSYKGGDILSKDFDEVSQMYKKSITKIKPRLWLDFFKLGPVKTVIKTRKYNTMQPEGVWAKIKDFFTDSSKNITKVKNKYFRGLMTKSRISNPVDTRIYTYDRNGNIKRIHVKPKAKGEKNYYLQYEYSKTPGPDGKYLLMNIIKTSDKAGKKPV